MHAPAAPRKRQFQQTSTADGSKAKRRLFSAAANDEDVHEYVTRELKKTQQEMRSKYNFDFAKGVPLPSSSVDVYVFSPVPESDVPAFYRTRRDSGFDSSFDAENKSPDSDVSSSDEVTFTPVTKLPSSATKKRRMQSSRSPIKKERRVTDYMSMRRKSVATTPKDSRPREQSEAEAPVNSQ